MHVLVHPQKYEAKLQPSTTIWGRRMDICNVPMNFLWIQQSSRFLQIFQAGVNAAIPNKINGRKCPIKGQQVDRFT